MAFSDLVADLDAVCVTTFGEVTGTIHFLDGSPDADFTGISESAAYKEGTVPGSAAGTGILYVFIEYRLFDGLTKQITNGDTATSAGVDYDIFDVEVDRANGASLKLRQRRQRYDQ